MDVYSDLNNFAEYNSKTVVDWVHWKTFVHWVPWHWTTLDSNSEANFERLRNGGVFASVLTRVTRNRTRTVRVKPGVRLHDVVAKVDELNGHQRFVAKFGSLSFDPTDIISITAERLLDHYTDEYRVDYDDMDLYRDFKKVVDPIE